MRVNPIPELKWIDYYQEDGTLGFEVAPGVDYFVMFPKEVRILYDFLKERYAENYE